MVPFQIKICGVTTVDDAIFACRHGADAIGLNFYDQSSRYVCPPGTPNSSAGKQDAAQIVTAIRQWSDSEDSPVKIVGVFVNLEVSKVVQIANDLGLDAVQLHGDEPAGHAEEIRKRIEPARPIQIVRAVRTNPSSNQQSDPEAEINRIETEIDQWARSGADAALLDAAVAGEFGGTGRPVDWFSVPKLRSAIPIVLAGGLKFENVAEAIECSRVQAVDVASGVESAPGTKDDELVRRFIEAARMALS